MDSCVCDVFAVCLIPVAHVCAMYVFKTGGAFIDASVCVCKTSGVDRNIVGKSFLVVVNMLYVVGKSFLAVCNVLRKVYLVK